MPTLHIIDTSSRVTTNPLTTTQAISVIPGKVSDVVNAECSTTTTSPRSQSIRFGSSSSDSAITESKYQTVSPSCDITPSTTLQKKVKDTAAKSKSHDSKINSNDSEIQPNRPQITPDASSSKKVSIKQQKVKDQSNQNHADLRNSNSDTELDKNDIVPNNNNKTKQKRISGKQQQQQQQVMMTKGQKTMSSFFGVKKPEQKHHLTDTKVLGTVFVPSSKTLLKSIAISSRKDALTPNRKLMIGKIVTGKNIVSSVTTNTDTATVSKSLQEIIEIDSPESSVVYIEQQKGDHDNNNNISTSKKGDSIDNDDDDDGIITSVQLLSQFEVSSTSLISKSLGQSSIGNTDSKKKQSDNKKMMVVDDEYLKTDHNNAFGIDGSNTVLQMEVDNDDVVSNNRPVTKIDSPSKDQIIDSPMKSTSEVELEQHMKKNDNETTTTNASPDDDNESLVDTVERESHENVKSANPFQEKLISKSIEFNESLDITTVTFPTTGRIQTTDDVKKGGNDVKDLIKTGSKHDADDDIVVVLKDGDTDCKDKIKETKNSCKVDNKKAKARSTKNTFRKSNRSKARSEDNKSDESPEDSESGKKGDMIECSNLNNKGGSEHLQELRNELSNTEIDKEKVNKPKLEGESSVPGENKKNATKIDLVKAKPVIHRKIADFFSVRKVTKASVPPIHQNTEPKVQVQSQEPLVTPAKTKVEAQISEVITQTKREISSSDVNPEKNSTLHSPLTIANGNSSIQLEHAKSRTSSPADVKSTIGSETSLVQVSEPTVSTEVINNVQDSDLSFEDLPITLKNLYTKNKEMRQRYQSRAKELLLQTSEEEFIRQETIDDFIQPNTFDAVQSAENGCFPYNAVMALAACIEGRSDTLSQLTDFVLALFRTVCNDDQKAFFSIENVSSKIKLIAARKNYVKNPHFILGASDVSASKVDTNIFEDDNLNFVWRWEVTVLELLPSDSIAKVKKARLARRKVAMRLNAISRLLSILHDADKVIIAGNDSSKLDAILAKISQEEEKVLKFDREDEKLRLLEESKKAKQRDLDSKRLEADRKKAEAENDKKIREVEKQQKVKEKEEQEKRQKEMKDVALKKQRSLLNSFLAKTAVKPSTTNSDNGVNLGDVSQQNEVAPKDFDIHSFRSSINSGYQTVSKVLPKQLSQSARLSRRKHTKQVTVSVLVARYGEDAFSSQIQYSEQQDIQVMNKYKFLSFHEDIRPPYYGTWSKASSVVTGRNPFGKDNRYLDYDNDSEGEWEEGDDELGEELCDANMGDDDDERDNEVQPEDEDGWLADDDEIDESLDEETKQLRRKKIEETKLDVNKAEKSLTLSFVSPCMGSPPERGCRVETSQYVGFANPDACFDLLDQYEVTQVLDCDLYLDAFPPIGLDEYGDCGYGDSSSTADISDDDMRCVARFIHNNTLGSKDKIIEELMKEEGNAIRSRAQASRIVDSIAEKKRDPIKGVFWEVKKQVLIGLDLVELQDITDKSKSDQMRKVALFIHNSTCPSKNKLVDDLRLQNAVAASSKAEAMRLFDMIAVKKKHATLGSYWQVKGDVRDKLGLTTELSMDPPTPEAFPSVLEVTSPKSPVVVTTEQEQLDEKENIQVQQSKQKESRKRSRPVESVLQKNSDKSPVQVQVMESSSPPARMTTPLKEQCKTKASQGSAKILAAFLGKK